MSLPPEEAPGEVDVLVAGGGNAALCAAIAARRAGASVLVVEAAKKSGSLITAHFALEQGREIFAIPGSIHNPLARGTHSLIKQGAKLVETVNDVLEEVHPLAKTIIDNMPTAKSTIEDNIELDIEYKNLLDCMGYDAVSVDDLVRLSGLTTDVVSSMLLILELDGLVESNNTGKYCRCS